MTRPTRERVEKLNRVQPGDIDLISKSVHHARIPKCAAVNPGSFNPCSRASGHDENKPSHSAQRHVHTGPGFVVLEVWT